MSEFREGMRVKVVAPDKSIDYDGDVGKRGVIKAPSGYDDYDWAVLLDGDTEGNTHFHEYELAPITTITLTGTADHHAILEYRHNGVKDALRLPEECANKRVTVTVEMEDV